MTERCSVVRVEDTPAGPDRRDVEAVDPVTRVTDDHSAIADVLCDLAEDDGGAVDHRPGSVTPLDARCGVAPDFRTALCGRGVLGIERVPDGSDEKVAGMRVEGIGIEPLARPRIAVGSVARVAGKGRGNLVDRRRRRGNNARRGGARGEAPTGDLGEVRDVIGSPIATVGGRGRRAAEQGDRHRNRPDELRRPVSHRPTSAGVVAH